MKYCEVPMTALLSPQLSGLRVERAGRGAGDGGDGGARQLGGPRPGAGGRPRGGARGQGRQVGQPRAGIVISAANRLIGEVVQSRRRPLLGPSPG